MSVCRVYERVSCAQEGEVRLLDDPEGLVGSAGPATSNANGRGGNAEAQATQVAVCMCGRTWRCMQGAARP
jgi:hypothetical protein